MLRLLKVADVFAMNELGVSVSAFAEYAMPKQSSARSATCLITLLGLLRFFTRHLTEMKYWR
jgi:hypothetical protein